MPFITASDRSEKLWGSLARWPLRFDLTTILISSFTLLFSLSAGVFHVGFEYGRWRHEDVAYGFITSDIAPRICMEVIVPLFAIVVASVNIWLYSSRTFTLKIALATSVLALLAWATILAFWVPEVIGRHRLQSIYAVRVIKLIGAILALLLDILYLACSSIALHRLRKQRPDSGVDLGSAPALELHSRHVSHTSLADLNTGLKPYNEFGRRRTSATPSYDDGGKGPRAEPREIF